MLSQVKKNKLSKKPNIQGFQATETFSLLSKSDHINAYFFDILW